ncbi:4-coumarate--CoA ligase-like 1 [Dichanthelium oligosanthes]|uniref:4-coumarate--CoA ligase n=1 Tax=Dichanthelium oligosanthes TaxID=888268 RepID=A0A1E5VR14_9POAL|nr:4-coumarate--CoA ligase-like 1 [Dichanthelium oligosanthes]
MAAGTASPVPAAGYGSDGVYRSPRPAAAIASDPALSLSDLVLRRAAVCPSALALVDAATGRALTFGALRSAVLVAAAALSSRARVRRGDVVLLLAPNCVLYPVCFLAVTALGAVVTTANPLYTPREIAKQSADARAKLVVTVSDLLPNIAGLRLPTILLDGDGASVPSDSASVMLYSDLVAGVQETEYRRPPTRQSDTAALFYSSGTTGESKGVVLTHRNFIAAATMVTSDQDDLGEGHNVFLCFLPMFHIFGMSVVTLGQLQRGNTVVVMARFDVDAVLAAVERHRVTYIFCAPPVMIALAKHVKGGRYDLSSLRCIGSGAAPLGKDVMEAVADKIPSAEIIQGYGMTETCGVTSLEYLQKGRARQFGSTGQLLSGVEAKIVDVKTMKHLPPNQLGEICVRGPNIMQGKFKCGVLLKTQGMGYPDSPYPEVGSFISPFIYWQIAPAELEGLLLSHAEILDAVVIPYPDPEAGEVPIAYVVPSPKSSLSEVDVQKFIEKQVTYYKRLRKVTFVDSVPKSASGKILRRELIAQVRSSKL